MSEDNNENHPRLASSIIGHNAAERVFLDAFNSDRLHHAWLITGSKGVGKASLAWRMAKFLAAQPSGDDTGGLFGEELPSEAISLDMDEDNTTIQRINAGGYADIIELARSENPKTGKLRNDIVIDDVRRLINFYTQTAAEGGWRIAIVDAADELNVSAANALLKLLEEPPEKSILFLISHSPGKLLPTIKSRCRQLKLNPLPVDSVKAVLASKFPEIAVDDMQALSTLSEGAPGRAIELANSEGLQIYKDLMNIIASMPRMDVPALHAFATSLANAKADAKYRLFLQLLDNLLQKIIKAKAVGASDQQVLSGENDIFLRISSSAGVDRWIELWEKMGELTARADRINLDRKQVLLTLFGDMSALTRG